MSTKHCELEDVFFICERKKIKKKVTWTEVIMLTVADKIEKCPQKIIIKFHIMWRWHSYYRSQLRPDDFYRNLYCNMKETKPVPS